MARKPTRTPSAALADLRLANDCLLSTADAARLLGMSPKTLRCLRCDRAGPPALKLGGAQQARVVYRRSALERWVRENATPVCGIESAG